MKIGTITPTLAGSIVMPETVKGKMVDVVPTTHPRAMFLIQNEVMMKRQYHKADVRLVVDYPQTRFPHDLTERYRYGLNELKDKVDLIFFIEDDDYYSPKYIDQVMMRWEDAGFPEVFGIGETYFYHPHLQYVWYRRHEIDEGPCAFQMCIRSDIVDRIDWSLIGDLFTDAGIWKQFPKSRATFTRGGRPLSVGIKHGLGVCGAGGHNAWFYEDMIRKYGSDIRSNQWAMKDREWLRHHIDHNDAAWYRSQVTHLKPLPQARATA